MLLRDRSALRLPDRNYFGTGWYFITICTQERLPLFGSIRQGKTELNLAGEMVLRWWNCLESRFAGLKTDSFIVMPDHVHGLLCFGLDHEPFSLGQVVGWFKAMSTNEFIRGVRSGDFPSFEKRIWQRNYYERRIRERRVWAVRHYIENNPQKWHAPK